MKRLVLTTTGFILAAANLSPTLLFTLVLPQQAIAQGLGGLGAETIRPQEKRRIAVMDFDFSNITDLSFLSGAGGEGAARGVSNLLTNQLVKDGAFVVIERSRIDAILAEQNLGASGRIEPTTAAQIGRVLGVDAVLIGTVTKFDVEDKSKGLQLGGLFGGGNRRQIATVQISSRLVSTATAEILTVADTTGTSEQKDNSVSVFGFGTTSQSDSRGKVLGAAAEDAIKQLSTQLTASAPKLAALPAVLPVINAVIADITGNQVVLNKGGQVGFRPGMVLSVERVIKRVKDPVTGKDLRVQTQSVGRLQLTEVDPQSSVAKILAGKGGIRVGDRVKAIK